MKLHKIRLRDIKNDTERHSKTITTVDVISGMAMDMEEGWYGAKMTGSSVKVAFPGHRKTTQNYRYIPIY